MERDDSPERWEIESSERLHDYGVFHVRRDRARSPRNGLLRDHAVVAARDGVTVVALTADGELVMVEQYRHGTRALSLETPSGLLEEGEEPVAAGRRELREETGYEVEDARELGAVAINASWETAHAHVVLASGARKAGEPELDPGEDPRTRLVPIEEVWGLVRRGEIDSAVVLSALLLLRLEEQTGGRDGAW
jgi:8-oxo-dGTP pyrophosphatase MutT (NUDIX family)